MGAKVYIDKDVRYVNQKILDAAKGQECTVDGPSCVGGTLTTVWCHSPYMEHGKAGSRKAHDCFGCFGCYACHDWLDGRTHQIYVVEKTIYFYKAMSRSWLILLRTGVLK